MNRLLAACLVLAACGTTGGSTPDPPDVFTKVCEPAACGAPVTVTDTAGFLARVPATWTAFAEYSNGCLPASDDLAVTGSITIAAADVTPPPQSLCSGGFCEPTAFMLRGNMAGVECLDAREFFDFTACGGLRITDATVRLRTVQRDIHPAPGNFIALVEVLAACEAPCAGNEFACAESHTCWPNARDQCAYCFGGTNAQCACWDGDDFAANGTACEVFLSGDVTSPGTCQAGACVTAQ